MLFAHFGQNVWELTQIIQSRAFRNYLGIPNVW